MNSKPYLVAGLAAAAALAQTPAFEVATVRESPPMTPESFRSGKLHLGMNVDEARVDIGSMPLATLIQIAYGVKEFQVSGPDWLRQERFDIVAKIPEGVSKDRVPDMLQALLAERFKLALHRENKDHPIYALVAGKNGPKLKPAAEVEDPAPNPPDSGRGFSIGTPQGAVTIQLGGRGAVLSGDRMGTAKVSAGPNGTIHMELSKITMAAFADMLTQFTDRPVLDMTELKGAYQVTLELSMQEMLEMARTRVPGLPLPPGGGFPGAGLGGPGAPGAPNPPTAADPSGGATIFQAVQQFGLKLEPRKAPVETIVVDHAEKTPTEN